MVVGVSNGTTQYHSTVPVFVNDNVWRHFTWTLIPNGNWTVYINGSNVWSDNSLNYPAAMNFTSSYLGKSNKDDPYYTGAIDEFRIYASALNATGVISLTREESTFRPTTSPAGQLL